MSSSSISNLRWTFLTNHGHVLVVICRNPDVRLREIAVAVGITERAAHAIVKDLEASGYIRTSKIGRRNRYAVNPHLPLRHPLERDHEVGNFLHSIGATAPEESPKAQVPAKTETEHPT